MSLFCDTCIEIGICDEFLIERSSFPVCLIVCLAAVTIVTIYKHTTTIARKWIYSLNFCIIFRHPDTYAQHEKMESKKHSDEDKKILYEFFEEFFHIISSE